MCQRKEDRGSKGRLWRDSNETDQETGKIQVGGGGLTSAMVFALLTTSMKPDFGPVAMQPYGMRQRSDKPSSSQSYRQRQLEPPREREGKRGRKREGRREREGGREREGEGGREIGHQLIDNSTCSPSRYLQQHEARHSPIHTVSHALCDPDRLGGCGLLVFSCIIHTLQYLLKEREHPQSDHVLSEVVPQLEDQSSGALGQD